MAENDIEQQAPASTQTPVDNSAIRELRAHSENLEKQLKEQVELARAAEAKLQEIERAKLDEVERLKIERDEAKNSIEELGKYKTEAESANAHFQKLYESELASIPEEFREKVSSVSRLGQWHERLDALIAAKSLIPSAPTQVGTTTQPAGSGGAAPVQQEAKTYDFKNMPAWNECFKK